MPQVLTTGTCLSCLSTLSSRPILVCFRRETIFSYRPAMLLRQGAADKRTDGRVYKEKDEYGPYPPLPGLAFPFHSLSHCLRLQSA